MLLTWGRLEMPTQPRSWNQVENTSDIAPTTSVKSGDERRLWRPRTKPERRRYNGRSPEAYRIRALEKQYLARVRNPDDPIVQAAVHRAAEMTMVAEALRAQAVRGEQLNITALVRAENLARRCVRELHLRQLEEQKPLSLSEYLSSKQTDTDVRENPADSAEKSRTDEAANPTGNTIQSDHAAATKSDDEAAA